MVKTITLNGTPPQLGEQLAENLLSTPINFAFDQLDSAEFELFCCALLSATAGMMAKKIGEQRVAVMTELLATVVAASIQEREGPLQ